MSNQSELTYWKGQLEIRKAEKEMVEEKIKKAEREVRYYGDLVQKEKKEQGKK